MKYTKELFEKSMTRKEFLQFAGMAVVALFGVSNFISFLSKHLSQSSHHSEVAKNSTNHGFGSRKFGE